VHSEEVNDSFAVNKIDDNTRLALDRQVDRAAANRAVFDQRLFGLRRVDLQRKNLAAMRTSDFSFD